MTVLSELRSATTLASEAYVVDHKVEAVELGRALAELVNDPAGFIATLRRGYEALADPAYLAGIEFVTPGIGPTLGVRNPLQSAVRSGLSRRLKGVSPAALLSLAELLSRDEISEMRWLGIWLTGRVLPVDPERAWQLLRRFARHAHEWVTVDTLGYYFGDGILREPYRWAELEQLVYSPSRWERRLVGSTLAELPFAHRDTTRQPEIARRGLELVGQLIGDREPDVQKALSWALRSLTLADPEAVAAFCRRESETAVANSDGNRAWVVRDALSKLPGDLAEELRVQLAGIRRRPGNPSTSPAAEASRAFFEGSGLPAATDLPEPPLT